MVLRKQMLSDEPNIYEMLHSVGRYDGKCRRFSVALIPIHAINHLSI